MRAYYAQVDFQTYVFAGIPTSGNIGVRVVTTDVDTEGTSSVEGEESAVSNSDKYTELMPSAKWPVQGHPGNTTFLLCNNITYMLLV